MNEAEALPPRRGQTCSRSTTQPEVQQKSEEGRGPEAEEGGSELFQAEEEGGTWKQLGQCRKDKGLWSDDPPPPWTHGIGVSPEECPAGCAKRQSPL